MDKHLEKLQKENEKIRNGFLLLFDIKNSTSRKQDYKNWKLQTETFYKIFEDFAESLATGIQNIYGTMKPEDQGMVVKFMGDAAFVFFPHSYATSKANDCAPQPDISIEIIKRSLARIFHEVG